MKTGRLTGMAARKYTKETLEEAVANSYSFAGVLRHLGLKQAGGTQAHIAKMIRQDEIDTSHFKLQAWNKGGISSKKKTPSEILIVLEEGSLRQKSAQLRRALIESGLKESCNRCSVELEWNGKPIRLEINHIDGNWLDNRIENLEFVCPNCHSQEEHTNMPHKNR